MAAYLLPSELLLFYDRRLIVEYASDTGAAVVDVGDSDIVLQAIQSASAELDASLQKGSRYLRQTLEDWCSASREDTNPAVTDTDKKRAAPIKELVAHLTYGRLVSRRGPSADAIRKLAPMYDTALQRLDSLCGGAAIFDSDSSIAAGVPKPTRIGRRNCSITATNRLFSTSPCGGLFPAGCSNGEYYIG